MYRRDRASRIRIALEGICSLVELDRDGTVVNLIGDGKGGIIVVRGTDEPNAVGYHDLTVDDVCRVFRPTGRHKVDHPLIMAGHFEDGQHFCEVILDTRQVHLVEYDKARIIAVGCLIEGTQELGLVKAL